MCKTSDLVTPDNGAVTISPTPPGDLREDNNINAVATFTCKDGFNLSSDVTRTCVLNTGWNGTTPLCGECCVCVCVCCPVILDLGGLGSENFQFWRTI